MYNRKMLNDTHEKFQARLAEVDDLGTGAGAERMLALVDEVRAERGDPPALLHQVVRLHEITAPLPEPGRKYALKCAILALDPAYQP